MIKADGIVTLTLLIIFLVGIVGGLIFGRRYYPNKVEILTSNRLKECKEIGGRYNVFWNEERGEVIYYDVCETPKKIIDLGDKK